MSVSSEAQDHQDQTHPRAARPTFPPLLDTAAVADVLSVSSRHIQRLVAERRIPFLRVGRFIRFDPAELSVWVDAQRVEVRRPDIRPSSIEPVE